MNMAELQNGSNRPICTVIKLQFAEKPIYECIKRLVDIVASFVALIILAIPMLLIGALIRLDSPGGAIYRQERLGKNGKPFILYKFRTMVQDAEKNGAVWAEKEDSRCTKFGRFLRLVRLDELMQLFNIFKGDMSIVGPRPERACFYDEFEEYIPGFSQRLCVKPGLTGFAQVNGGYDLKPEEKIIWDLEYIEKRSLWLDFKILLKTVGIVLNHNGAR